MVNLKGWMMILELHQQGLTVSAIAERTGHDRKTVRKWFCCNKDFGLRRYAIDCELAGALRYR